MWRRLLPIGTAVLLFVILGNLLLGKKPATTLHTIAFATDPVAIWSVDTVSGNISIVLLPADATADAALGYGKYPLSSLWKLGSIDGLGGTLFAKSIEQTLGVATPWYVGTTTDSVAVAEDPVAFGKQYFRFWNPGAYLGGYKANIPISLFVPLALTVSRAKADQIAVHDVRNSIQAVTETLPDGSVRTVLDQTQLDELLKGTFEDPQIRREALSLAVYNTTSTLSLGTKAARQISALGGFVVSVGNAEPALEDCTLTTTKQFEKTKTVAIVAELFHCKIVVGEAVERADVAVRVGRRYQALFESKK